MQKQKKTKANESKRLIRLALLLLFLFVALQRIRDALAVLRLHQLATQKRSTARLGDSTIFFML